MGYSPSLFNRNWPHHNIDKMIDVTVGPTSVGIKLEDTLYNIRALVLDDSRLSIGRWPTL